MVEKEEKSLIDDTLDYKSSKLICSDLLAQEIKPYVLLGQAVAEQRKNIFIESTFDSIIQNGVDPESVKESFSEPSMQSDYIAAANGYIKYGDEELLKVLSDILTIRIKEKDKSLLQVVLGESIKICPLLINKQMATLAIRFLIAHTKRLGIRTIDQFKDYFNKEIVSIYKSGVAKEQSDFQHLNYTRCATTTAFSNDLIDAFKANYKNVFSIGKTKEEIGKKGDQYIVDSYPFLFINSWADANRFVTVLDSENPQFNPVVFTLVSDEIKEIALSTLNNGQINNNTIKKKLEEEIPEWNDFLNYWEKSGINHLNLTSVGIVIGAIYASRITNSKFDLNIWIK